MVGSSRSYVGHPAPFAVIEVADEYLHAPEHDATHADIETNLFGFNVPEADINSNIYVLWRPIMGVMSAHIFVAKGARAFGHQLEADYFNEHLYLPAVSDNRDYAINLGGCRASFKVMEPLRRIALEFSDPARAFHLSLTSEAVHPPVGRPGGKHFTQLMRNKGRLVLNGGQYDVDSFYMRDRSWSYPRPERPETTPPYCWMTGWTPSGAAFVIAWLDVEWLDDVRFGPNWQDHAHGADAQGANKWESGGATPSLNLRSGWICGADGKARLVSRVDIRRDVDALSPLRTRAIAFDIFDEDGRVHEIRAETQQSFPKMYWQNLLVHMNAMRLTINGEAGAGDLMDTFSSDHIRAALRQARG